MIEYKLTFEEFGYKVESLSKGSKKKIKLRCDYCKIIYEGNLKQRNVNNKDLDKDACKNCRFRKREEVSLKKYGVKNSAQKQEVRDKIRKASVDRLRSDDFKKKAAKTNLEKYGCEIAMQSDEVKEKHKKSVKQKYGVENVMQVKSISAAASEKMIKTKIKKGLIITYDGKTRPELAREAGFSRSHFGKLVNKYGFEKAIAMTPTESGLETIFREWLDSEGIQYDKQFRVENKIADFKIGNLLIELDGLYWHSDAAKLDKNYHMEKHRIYTDNDYIPLFFRENEINNQFDIVKSIVLNKLGRSKRVFARKCKVKEVDKQESRQFFNDNHLMGSGRGPTFGLYYNNELFSATQIKRIRDNNYEISRFCNKIGFGIIGGFSRLISHVEKELNPESITTFIDCRYGQGDYLYKFGFKKISCHASFKWTDGKEVFNRMKFPGNSGYDYGLLKIWDCGQTKYVRY